MTHTFFLHSLSYSRIYDQSDIFGQDNNVWEVPAGSVDLLMSLTSLVIGCRLHRVFKEMLLDHSDMTELAQHLLQLTWLVCYCFAIRVVGTVYFFFQTKSFLTQLLSDLLLMLLPLIVLSVLVYITLLRLCDLLLCVA